MKQAIEINFKEIQPVDLFGNHVAIENLHEIICNVLYTKTGSIRVSDIVRELFYGKSVEVDLVGLEELLLWVPGCFSPLVQDALLKYLNEKLNNLKLE